MKLRKVGSDTWEIRHQVRRRFRGKSRAERFRKNLKSLLAEAERNHKTNTNPERSCYSIREGLESFLDDSIQGLRRGLRGTPCKWETARRHRRRLQALDTFFRSAPLDCITQEMVESYIERRLESVGRDTVNVDIGSLRAFARWAQRKKRAPEFLELMLIERLPEPGKIAGTNRKPPKTIGMDKMRRRILKIEALRDDVGLFLRGMILFGLRPAGVAALTRGDAVLPNSLEPGSLHCMGLKGRPDRDIPIVSGSAHEAWVRACLSMGDTLKGMGATAPLVPRRIGKSGRRLNGWTSKGLAMVLYRLCRRLRFKFTAYQVRHTCISWMQASGFSLAAVAVYADHGKITTQAAYAHQRIREGLDAYKSIGDVMQDLPY